MDTFGLAKSCENEAISQWMEVRRRAPDLAKRDGRVARDAFFFEEQNARLLRDAEEYYRAIFHERVSSWKLRDTHMTRWMHSRTISVQNPGLSFGLTIRIWVMLERSRQ
jgi:erythromycin esterase-like protein